MSHQPQTPPSRKSLPPHPYPKTHHPPTSQTETVYAKWRGRTATKDPRNPLQTYTDRYHIVIPPRRPISVGNRIKIRALSLEAYHIPNAYPSPAPRVYESYDPCIEGRLIRIRAMTAETVEFVLDNEVKDAAVTIAYVAIQHIPNVTTALEMVEKVCKWATTNEHNLQDLPLETAIVIPDPTPRERGQTSAEHGNWAAPPAPVRMERSASKIPEMSLGRHGRSRGRRDNARTRVMIEYGKELKTNTTQGSTDER